MEIRIGQFICFFPLSRIVRVRIFPYHLIPEYQIIRRFLFQFVKQNSAPLTTLYHRFHPYICWRVHVHLLPLNIFIDMSLVTHSHFFFAGCFSRCRAMVFTIFATAFTWRKDTMFWNNGFNCRWKTIICLITTIGWNSNGRLIFVIQVRIRRSPTFVISIFIFRCDFFWH